VSALYVFLFHLRETAIDNPVFAVFVHADAVSSAFGHYAVSIFIVISGYCLAEPLAAQPGRPFDVRAFARRRLRRIYPAYLGALVLSALFFYAWSVPMYHGAETALASCARAWDARRCLVHNLIYGTKRIPQTGRSGASGLEAQIYVVFALILVPLWRRYGVWAQLAMRSWPDWCRTCWLHGALD